MFSFQFETETEDSKLRRDVLAEGHIGSGGAPAGIISMLSGKEEMFAFRRAVYIYLFLFIIYTQTCLWYSDIDDGGVGLASH